MKKFLVDYWKRNGDEKDCFQDEVQATTPEQAIEIISNKRGVIKSTIQVLKQLN